MLVLFSLTEHADTVRNIYAILIIDQIRNQPTSFNPFIAVALYTICI